MVTSSASKYCLFPFYYSRVDLVHIGELCDLCHICINKLCKEIRFYNTLPNRNKTRDFLRSLFLTFFQCHEPSSFMKSSKRLKRDI
jgi:hypothetical protein